jgi:tetraacyldisaccharide-1-P 4'-kinase
MTQKDAVRCRELANPRLWYVPVVARFSDTQRQELLNRVIGALTAASIASSLQPGE